MVRRLVCCQRPRNGGLGMIDLESHWLAERLAYLGRSLSRDTVWGQKMRDIFPRLESDPETGGRCKPKGAVPFTRECRKAISKLPRSSDLSQSRKELYRELVLGSVSDPLVEWLSGSLEEIRSQRNWVSGSGFLNNSEFSLTWWFARNTLPLADWAFKAGLADMPDCLRVMSVSERPASIPNSSCCSTLVTSWTMLTLRGEKRVVFLAI